MSDAMLLAVGALVFGLMFIGIALTIVEFRRIPRKQEPVFEEVAFQAQPDDSVSDKSAQ